MNIVELLKSIMNVPTDFQVLVNDGTKELKRAKFVAIDMQKRQILIFTDRKRGN